MTGKLSKFLALSRAEKSVFLASLLLLPLFWGGLRVFGFARFQSWLERPGLVQNKPASIDDLAAAGRLVNLAARYSPGPVTCLSRSMLLRRLLQRRGIGSDLRIGVRIVQGKLDAHAWVEHSGIPINDTLDVAERYPAFEGPITTELFSAP